MKKKIVKLKRKSNTILIQWYVIGIASIFVLTLGVWLLHPHISAKASNPIFQITDAQKYGFEYAYAPSIIQKDGVFHVFFCSKGEPGAWDFIRYTKSSDNGKTWSTPKILVKAQFNGTSNVAACDPSVVFFNNYYYMFYSSAYRTLQGSDPSSDVWLTNIQVARASSIGGTYQTYTNRNTWESNPNDPKVIIKPFVEKKVPGYYGAGQQTVVAKDGKLKMWYTDDTFYNDGIHTFYTESTNPVSWSPSSQKQINITGAHSVDVKYTSLSNTYVMARIINPHEVNSYLTLWQSQDGLTWSLLKTVSPEGSFPDYAHNVGISSDRTGKLLTGQNMIGFGAAPGLISDQSWGKWNLFGLFTDPFSP